MYRKLRVIGVCFLLPFFLVYLSFNMYPIIHTIYLSFTKFDGINKPEFIGLTNYINLLSDFAFWRAFLHTWQIWIPNIIMQLSLALFLAVLFTNNRLKLRGVPLYRAIFYFPNLITAASIALLFVVLLDWQNGAVNQFLFGSDKTKYVNWLINPVRSRFAISMIQAWMWFGNSLILLIAGLNAIPITYYEAADVDGASSFKVFFHISVPLLAPILTYVLVTSLIGGVQIFDVPYVIANGPAIKGQLVEKELETAVSFLYNTAFRYNRFGYGAAVAYFLFAITAFLSFCYMFFIQKKEEV